MPPSKSHITPYTLCTAHATYLKVLRPPNHISQYHTLTHSPISCLTPGRQRREIFLSFYLSPQGSGASGSPITRWSISASFVAWPDCSFLGSLDLGPADYLQRNLSVEQRSDWDAERTEGDQGDSWFLPLAMSVMGLYGLTVTMRIHQLLTMRKISDHLKHLCWLCWLLVVGDADESSLKKSKWLLVFSRRRSVCFLVIMTILASSIDQSNCQRGRSYGLDCWVNPLVMSPDNHPKWP